MRQFFKELKNKTKLIGNYNDISIEELANRYIEMTKLQNTIMSQCDTENISANSRHSYITASLLRDAYMGALILKYWFLIGKMDTACKAIDFMDFEDFYERAFYCIDTACFYAKWQIDDSVNADQCIKATFSKRGAPELLYESNLKKNIANINKGNLDTIINPEKGTTICDTLSAETDPEKEMKIGYASKFIQSYLDNDKVIEAILFDVIANQDVINEEKETTVKENIFYNPNKPADEKEDPILLDKTQYITETSYTASFWPRKAIGFLANLTKPENEKEFTNYKNTFMNSYKVSESILEAALQYIKKANNQKLYNILDKTLKSVDKEAFLACI